MIGSKPRMPKAARYPLFLLGLAIILIGGLEEQAAGASPEILELISVAGLLVLFFAVAIK